MAWIYNVFIEYVCVRAQRALNANSSITVEATLQTSKFDA